MSRSLESPNPLAGSVLVMLKVARELDLELTPETLAKLLYLADLDAVESGRTQFSGATWRWDDSGPYDHVLTRAEDWVASISQAVDLIRRKANVVIHEMVDVLRPFYRDGRHIPPLLRPRAHVTVDPAVRGGVPVIEGTRVPYDEVAALFRDGLPPRRGSPSATRVSPLRRPWMPPTSPTTLTATFPKEPREAAAG